MKKYIIIDSNKFIINVCFEENKDTIYLDDVEKRDVHINGKCISDDIGVPIFQYIKGKVIENYDDSKLKEYQKQQSNSKIHSELLDIDRLRVRPATELANPKIQDKSYAENKIIKLEEQAIELRKQLK